MDGDPRTSVLFVCMGNICRSPLAEAVFLRKISERGLAERFRVDSAGTGDWHVGSPPDPRMTEVAADHGIPMLSRARVVTAQDLASYDLLVCMDEDNRARLLDLGAIPSKVRLLLEFDGAAGHHEVPDPYYGGPEGFHLVYHLVDHACDALLTSLLGEPNGAIR